MAQKLKRDRYKIFKYKVDFRYYIPSMMYRKITCAFYETDVEYVGANFMSVIKKRERSLLNRYSVP